MIGSSIDYPLHLLGWKGFQDICVAVAEDVLKRPVQTFLPSNDAGRDGAFVGCWDEGAMAGSSTIQCKFSDKPTGNINLSILGDELCKATHLAVAGLADDYIIMTNLGVTGQTEMKIKQAFEAAGVGRCRVFHGTWIRDRIRSSARLRMLAPRLYGMGDLSDLLDARAYKQAQLILSEMGDNLRKLVVTEAHRRSVRAIDEHRLVLLLGSPAAGKSTIGASLAVGAADAWNAYTIKATSPEQLHERINPDEAQFVWVDDAWGSTQFQRGKIEAWNAVFPLMQAAMKRGTRFLLTSRDYIWRRAKDELKLQAIPSLQKSQVVIDVHDFTLDEKARILYNHLKLGSQPIEFRTQVKAFLPELTELQEFLPESARRLSDPFFTSKLTISRSKLTNFFRYPEEFLLETISQLAADCRAAIALIFMAGGMVRSPVEPDRLSEAAEAYGAEPAAVKLQLSAMSGSLLLLAQDEDGYYWTYRHPTVGDAFAIYVSRDPEQVEIYLRGARPSSIVEEVVCSGISLHGSKVVVPVALLDLLATRIGKIETHQLVSFMSYRANAAFSKVMLQQRPDVLAGMKTFYAPIADDSDARLLVTLHSQGLLSEELRLHFVAQVKLIACDQVDPSFVSDDGIRSVLTDAEVEDIFDNVEQRVIEDFPSHVDRVRSEWNTDYDPADHFDSLKKSFRTLVAEVRPDRLEALMHMADGEIHSAVMAMEDDYTPASDSSPAAIVQQSHVSHGELSELFRDIDD